MRVAATEHTEECNSDAERIGSLVDSPQCIHQQDGPKARSAVALIATDHGDEDRAVMVLAGFLLGRGDRRSAHQGALLRDAGL